MALRETIKNRDIFVVGNLNLEDRLLHYILSYVIIPKFSNHSTTTFLAYGNASTFNDYPHCFESIEEGGLGSHKFFHLEEQLLNDATDYGPRESFASMKVKWILLLRRQEKKTTLVIKKHHVVLVIMALSNIPKVSKIKKRLKC
ncbi:hypothetical protein Lal_00002570 [Lupinus albus]|nr:hypothetical protein Lal_00002570 [Lupinus albus]